MKEKLIKFMQGRYGVDQLSKFLVILGFILVVLSSLFRTNILYFLGAIAVILSYARVLSKNHPKRYKENQLYLKYTAQIRKHFNKEKYMIDQRKTYHIYTCPSCKQKIRIPKGKGKISVKCPKCGTEFVKKS